MDLNQKRDLLETLPNPNKNIDYLITLKAKSPDGTIEIQLRYIPDRMILSAQSFPNYVSSLFKAEEQTLEHYATRLAEDIHDELVTRWINASFNQIKSDGSEHCITIEDRQPQWNNQQLIARLKFL